MKFATLCFSLLVSTPLFAQGLLIGGANADFGGFDHPGDHHEDHGGGLRYRTVNQYLGRDGSLSVLETAGVDRRELHDKQLEYVVVRAQAQGGGFRHEAPVADRGGDHGPGFPGGGDRGPGFPGRGDDHGPRGPGFPGHGDGHDRWEERAEAFLMIDGQYVGGSQIVDRFSRDLYFYIDQRQKEFLDLDRANVQIIFRGEVFVEGVGVQLSERFRDHRPDRPFPGHLDPIPQPAPAPIAVQTANVQQYLQGNVNLDLNGFFNLRDLLARGVTSIVVKASSAGGTGTAELCGRGGCTVSQAVANNVSDVVFYLPSQFVDSSAPSLSVGLHGNFWVESITLQFAQR